MPNAEGLSESLAKEIATLRDTMLRVHYFEESHWLAAAVAFPGLCASPIGQAALRSAATIAWQFGHPAVTRWLNTAVLADMKGTPHETDLASDPLPQFKPLPDSV